MKSAIKFKIIKLESLVPYAKNSRTHSETQIAQIAASIQEFGFTNPVLIGEDNVLIAGHGRVLAARKLSMREVPCMIIAGLTETQRRALVLADNRLALSAGWDAEMLALEMKALMDDGYDMALTGFDEDEIAKFLHEDTEGLTDPDAVPELGDEPVSVLGDIWTLGGHRLMCGDSTSATDVEALLAGVAPHLMVTDPPYGVEYDPDWRNRADRADGTPIGASSIGTVSNDDKSDWRDAWVLFPGDVAYCWHAGLHASNTQQAFEACGFQMRSQIIWAKNQFAISRGHYHVQHEPCFYFVRKKSGSTGHWKGDRKQTTLWEIDKNRKNETGHSTQKPVECMKRPIENNSSPGQAVYEPFSGSGTTIIAAEMTGRKCYAMEISPAYVDMAVKRWEQFTGKEAIHAQTGKRFNNGVCLSKARSANTKGLGVGKSAGKQPARASRRADKKGTS